MKPGGQRRKGRAFEQRIVRTIKARFEGVEAHRSSQADRAWDADIVVKGHPVLERLWMELTDGDKAEGDGPRRKLEQAEADSAAQRRNANQWDEPTRLPVCVWHRLRSWETHVTMRLGTLLTVAHVTPLYAPDGRSHDNVLVTMSLDDFLEVIA